LKPNCDLLVLCVPRPAVPGALRGLGGDGAGRVRRLLVPILLFGGFGYENLRHAPLWRAAIGFHRFFDLARHAAGDNSRAGY
jgi:hypothetical protein